MKKRQILVVGEKDLLWPHMVINHLAEFFPKDKILASLHEDGVCRTRKETFDLIILTHMSEKTTLTFIRAMRKADHPCFESPLLLFVDNGSNTKVKHGGKSTVIKKSVNTRVLIGTCLNLLE